MLRIRLRRQGAKGRPYYRVVVIDSRAARDGRALEVVGYYDPTVRPEGLTADTGRIGHWVARGARLSDTVRTLLARHGKSSPAAGDDTSAAEAPPPGGDDASAAGAPTAGGDDASAAEAPPPEPATS